MASNHRKNSLVYWYMKICISMIQMYVKVTKGLPLQYFYSPLLIRGEFVKN